MKSLLAWLLLPLASCAQSLEESWFVKTNVDDNIIINAKYQDPDTSSNLMMYEIKNYVIYVNYIKDQIIYTLDRNKHRMEIYLLFDWQDRYTRTEVDWEQYIDMSDYLEYIQSLLPCKIVKI